MRLFIAINFDDKIKNNLCSIIENLEANAEHGNFTCRDNLHLTLIFIGETTNIDVIKQAMDTVNTDDFELAIRNFGKFKRNGGDIYWLGIENNHYLTDIYHRLYESLIKAGFKLENREYKPHLTLGREVMLKSNFNTDHFKNNIPNMSTGVSKISLIKSERIAGKLTYTEVYAKPLNKK